MWRRRQAGHQHAAAGADADADAGAGAGTGTTAGSAVHQQGWPSPPSAIAQPNTAPQRAHTLMAALPDERGAPFAPSAYASVMATLSNRQTRRARQRAAGEGEWRQS